MCIGRAVGAVPGQAPRLGRYPAPRIMCIKPLDGSPAAKAGQLRYCCGCRHADSRSFWWVAISAFVALAAAQAADAARAAKLITVSPTTPLQMAGSDIFCTVVTENKAPLVACFHDPGGASSSVRKGYAIAATDGLVAVEPSKSNTPVFSKDQPSLAKVAVFSKGTASAKVITMNLGDVAAVGGTRMAIVVTTAKGGGDAMGVVYLDAKNHFVVGTYTVGISNTYVTVSRIDSQTKGTVVYRHAVG